MTEYRRPHTPGATWFFTVNLAQRSDNSLLVDHIDDLRLAVRKVKQAHPFRIDAMVVLPEHLHAIWTLPVGDSDIGKRWALIKSGFSRVVPQGEFRTRSRVTRGERGIWQRRFWEHQIRDEVDMQTHVDYIHFNPVKHRWVQRVGDWPYSTFHKFVRNGWCGPEMASTLDSPPGGAGE